MMHWMGGILVVGGTAWVGFRAAAELRMRVRALRDMAQMLRLLEQELELHPQPMSRLMDTLIPRCHGPARLLAEDCRQALDRLGEAEFSLSWRQSVQRCVELGEEGRRCLLPLGDTLGRYDSGEQCRTLAVVRQRLELLADREEAECRRQGRVYQVLGLSGGMFLMILLL